jgi:PEP-CTERM motif
MRRHSGSKRRLAWGLAAFVFLLGGWTTNLRAGIAYGYAEQTISNLTILPAINALGGVTTSTSDSATLNGSGLANSNALDAPQAYIGGTPVAPQNDFTRYAPGAIPVSPAGNFTRGDALIASLTAPNSSSVVSESFLNTTTPTSETASSSLTASLLFTPTATGALAMTYNFANDAYVFTTDSGSATANFNFNITIKDLAGNIVFSSSTANTNLTLASPPNGGEVIRNGMETVTTTSLTAGTSYSLIFSDTTGTSALVSIPEPSSVVLLGLGGVAALVVFRRRKVKD